MDSSFTSDVMCNDPVELHHYCQMITLFSDTFVCIIYTECDIVTSPLYELIIDLGGNETFLVLQQNVSLVW